MYQGCGWAYLFANMIQVRSNGKDTSEYDIQPRFSMVWSSSFMAVFILRKVPSTIFKWTSKGSNKPKYFNQNWFDKHFWPKLPLLVLAIFASHRMQASCVNVYNVPFHFYKLFLQDVGLFCWPAQKFARSKHLSDDILFYFQAESELAQWFMNAKASNALRLV